MKATNVLDPSPVLLGMTRGEWTLVLFIFGLVYSAGLLVRFGEWFGERAFRSDGPSNDGDPGAPTSVRGTKGGGGRSGESSPPGAKH
ncbi:MAG: hypothetical protein U0174_23185 [Polyangiaceae bacterium]